MALQDVVSISVRRGGIDNGQSYNKWLSTISKYPNVISMSLVPITSLLNSVPGNGFLSHAVNLYLRCEWHQQLWFLCNLLLSWTFFFRNFGCYLPLLRKLLFKSTFHLISKFLHQDISWK